MTYSDRLARKGIRPIVIERTDKRAGDVVLQSWAAPVVRVAEVRP